MKKYLFLIPLFAIVLSSCKKNNDCTATAPATQASASETAYLQSYLSANSITPTGNTHGMFYLINHQGSGTSPNLCNSIQVIYAGILIAGTTDGAQFDTSSGASVTLTLSQLIAGWELVMPLIKTGGTVTLYIPPSLGYGSTAQTNSAGATVIPANSYLKFTITLGGVN